jgi:hypothetical protein
MSQTIENLSRPGEEPADGDMIKQTNGKVVRIREYHVPASTLEESAYLEEFTATQLRDSFTADEAISAIMSDIPAVAAQANLLMIGRPVTIHKDDPGYRSMIFGLEAAEVLVDGMGSEYRKGIPADRFVP